MLYPKEIESKLGFDKIRSFLKSECLSSLGASFVNKLRFSNDFSLIQKLLNQTEEFKSILLTGENFPSTHYFDVNNSLKKLEIEGTFLSEEEFFDIYRSLKTITSCFHFFQQKSEHYPNLQELTNHVELDQTVIKAIDRKIDDKGKLRNNASPTLQEVRMSLNSKQVQLRNMLDKILRKAKSDGITPDDVSLTVREGRMVIPVTASNKRAIKGFIHDESATGQTVFMEPAEALEINNDIRDLEYQEKREVIRILTELTKVLRAELYPLRKAYHFLGIVDFIRAKAKFAIKVEANLPKLSKKCELEWRDAKHPLLYLAHLEQNKGVVPLNLKINENQRIILVSGPNAGGKSVSLKTLGLVQYTIQCGLLPSISSDSTAGIFNNIFIDIGDEQSIENDLSTYSSHLSNMSYFIKQASEKTLFLIDEFGTGTEPQFGGAIAESILEKLNEKKAHGFINTHYANLKKFAEKNEGVINAAMRFNMDKLAPTYELELGKPGNSFALEIARKMGIPHSVLAQAKKKVGYSQVNFDKLIGQLETEKIKLKETNARITQKENKLKQTQLHYTELKSKLENKKTELLNKARVEAKNILDTSNKKVEQAIRQIKEVNAEKEKTKEIRSKLEEHKATVKVRKAKKEPSTEVEVIGGAIKVGSSVRVKGQEAIGEVAKLMAKDAEVSFGSLVSKIKLNRLEKVSRKEKRLQENTSMSPVTSKKMGNYDVTSKMSMFSANLDVRGKRVEEVFSLLTNFLDEANMLGRSNLKIVHGKGNGILRDFIRKQLEQEPNVKFFEDEHSDLGGAGVTIVTLK